MYTYLMEYQSYILGFKPADSGPLSRFLPPLDEGVISAWLSLQTLSGNWLLDPYGFSPRLVLEAARSGYRVLVTANNPITRFLLEIFANPPPEVEFIAALADLGAIKKGDERLESHLQSLYTTSCEKCNQQIQAQAFLWKKGEDSPYAKLYECKYCNDNGERLANEVDKEHAKKIAETDTLHRSRLFERVVSLKDEDRIYAEEAIEHYLPRPLYALSTIINRLDNLELSPERKRALTALVLLACDAGNTLWAYPEERKRPKQLSTPNQFKENNIWMMLERGVSLFAESGSPVVCEAYPAKIPESGGILIYEGRLKDLAEQVKREIPIAAVIGAVPRPNQAFWTLSALWAGWLWGKDFVEPYKVALRRRRYDWAWNATALFAMFNHLNDLLADGVPMFGLLPEPEPAFLTSAMTAAWSAGFKLQSLSARTELEPVQIVWKSAKTPNYFSVNVEALKNDLKKFLSERAEPTPYFHVHVAGLIRLAENNNLRQTGIEFDEALRKTHQLFENVLKDEKSFVHYSTGEAVDTGLWDVVSIQRRLSKPKDVDKSESLSDQIEKAIVNYLQKNPNVIFLEVDEALSKQFTGLKTPPKDLIYAVLHSYAINDKPRWKLRDEDIASVRRDEIKKMIETLQEIGKRLNYDSFLDDKVLVWRESKKIIRKFYVMASAILNKALDIADEQTVIVVPGGRADLIAYKLDHNPALKERLQKHRLVKFRTLRDLLEIKMLTRETFEEQISSDPLEKSSGQMMMF